MSGCQRGCFLPVPSPAKVVQSNLLDCWLKGFHDCDLHTRLTTVARACAAARTTRAAAAAGAQLQDGGTGTQDGINSNLFIQFDELLIAAMGCEDGRVLQERIETVAQERAEIGESLRVWPAAGCPLHQQIEERNSCTGLAAIVWNLWNRNASHCLGYPWAISLSQAVAY